jgi:hypothetical protein
MFQVNAQIKKVDESQEPVIVGKAGDALSTQATMYKTQGNPDYYFVTFKNAKYQSITDFKSFGFKDIDGAYDYLFNSVVKASKENKKEVEFELEDGRLTVEIYRSMGVVSTRIYWSENGVLSYTGYITAKKFSALFNKPYNKKDWK